MTVSNRFVTLLAGALLMTTIACSRGQSPSASSAATSEAETPTAEGAIASHGTEPASGEGAVVASGTAGAASATATAELPEGHPPMGDAGAIATATVDPTQALGAAISQAIPVQLTWTVPATWKEQPTTSKMRRAQYRIPPVKGDSEPAECLVFYFGPKQGGSAEANAQRWVDQFRQPDGASSQSRSKIDVRTINGYQVMFVNVKGTYNPMAMPGAPESGPKPGYAMIGAIVSAPDAPWFFKMTGPERTVEANSSALDALVSSLRPE